MRPSSVAILASLLFAPGCATIVPPAQPAAPTTMYVRAAYDTVWERTISFFADSRIPIQTIDKASGLIATTKFALTGEALDRWADCGKTSDGASALAKLESVHNTPRVVVDFNVFIRPTADSASVRINLGLSANADSPMGSVSVVCVSNGRFERELLASLQRQSSE